jgi:hypothetical protein
MLVAMTPSNVILEDYNRPNQNYWTNQNLVYYELIWLLMRLDQTWMHFNLISSIWTSKFVMPIVSAIWHNEHREIMNGNGLKLNIYMLDGVGRD